MSGSASGSKSKSKNAYNFGQSIPQFQVNALNQLYGAAQNLFGQTGQPMAGMAPNVSGQMGNIASQANPAWQQNLNGGVYGNQDILGQLTNSLTQSLNSPSQTSQIYANIMGGNGNNYADAMKSSLQSDAARATSNMLNTMDTRAAAAGMSGGSRHGVTEAQGLYDINNNLQKNLADIGYDTFNQDLNNKMGIAQQADSNTLSRQQMLQTMLGNKQDTINNAIGQGSTVQNLGMGVFAPYMAPWDALNNYGAAIGSPTVLSFGSGSGNSKGIAQSASGGK